MAQLILLKSMVVFMLVREMQLKFLLLTQYLEEQMIILAHILKQMLVTQLVTLKEFLIVVHMEYLEYHLQNLNFTLDLLLFKTLN